MAVIASAKPPNTTTTGSLFGLSLIRWFESKRARSAVLSSSAVKLDRSVGRATESLSILRRTGWWRCLCLILVPALTNCFQYLSKTTSTLWYVAPILYTVLENMQAYSPKAVTSGGFPSAITSAWPSISRQLGLASVTFAGVWTCFVRMLTITDLLVGWRLPFVEAKDGGMDMSSCWTMFSRLTLCAVL